jgi:SAM-dependent methyltransferase
MSSDAPTLPYFPRRSITVEDVPCPGCGDRRHETITESMDFDYLTTDLSFRIVRCSACSLIYINPRPGLSEISKIYPPEYSAYHFNTIGNPVIRRARNFMQAGKARGILRCVPQLDGQTSIVDVGCGSPALLDLIRDNCSVPIRLYGNDFNSETLRLIEEKGHEAIAGPFECVKWDNNFFDVVVMNQVIEHLFDIPGVLSKTFDLLKPGGAFYIETPSVDGLDARLFQNRHWGGYHLPRHLQLFNARTISTTLSRYGFAIESIGYIPSPNFWTSSLRNFLMLKGLPLSLAKRMSYRNVPCMAAFTFVDTLTRRFHPTSNMRVIARKGI